MPATTPVYYINLASRSDRRAFMERQFEVLGIDAERIDAVRIDEVPKELVAFHRSRKSLWRLAASDLACGLSHQRAWTRLDESGQTAALVLEDDAILADHLVDFVQQGLLERIGADLVKLETYRTAAKVGGVADRIGDVELRELCSSHMGSAAYLIGRETAQRSLRSPLRDQMGIDRFLFGRGGPHLLSSRVLQAVPSPAIQIDKLADGNAIGESDIVKARPVRTKTEGMRPPLHVVQLHVDHVLRLMALGLRDAAALRAPRQVVPFAGAERS